MPDEIYATPRGSGTMSGVYVDIPIGDEERGEHKYHHERVVTDLQERNARLVDALETQCMKAQIVWALLK